MAENETDEQQQAERARRDAAAARRQRILEGAETRMDVVEGRQAGTSTSSKLAAMRKRRFKKKTTTTTDTSTAETATGGGKEAAASNDEPITATSPTAVVDDDPPTTTTSGDEVDDAARKKYMGVARMRRKMIKEKQQQQQPTAATATTTTDTATYSKKRSAAKNTPYSTVPILMHIVTVLLLFFAGLDIGLQQAPLSVDVMDIHTDFAPRHSGGVHRILQYTTGSNNNGDTDDRATKKKPAAAEQTYFHDAAQTEDDEFADAKPLPMDIDPIFGVDLDELTAGSGIVPMAARQAVKVHRFLLRLLYFGPLRCIDWLLSLTTLPPVLCLVAILLRQLIGKTILGASLPSPTDTNNAKGGGDPKGDVIGMAQNFVFSFVQNSFPTAVLLYDMWKHLRADMYVIFCGLFVGLAFGHHPQMLEGTVASGKDEL